jgi:hypothetical protein
MWGSLNPIAIGSQGVAVQLPLILRCGFQIVLFFLAFNIGEPLAWHSTLSRTRQLYGEEIFKQLFNGVLKQCMIKAW